MPGTAGTPGTVALIGGTGPEGRGLAARFALAGRRVAIGSRDAARGEEAAAGLRAALAGLRVRGELRGGANADAAADAEIAIVTVPYEGHAATLASLAGALAGRIVVDAVVPMRFERGPRPIETPDGSATEEAARLLSGSRVTGAFHNLSAEALLDAGAPVRADVLVTGNDAAAKRAVRALAEEIEGVRAVDAGPLRYSRFVEGLTILLVGINGRHRARAHVRVEGLPDADAP